jgi:hypothetical protein
VASNNSEPEANRPFADGTASALEVDASPNGSEGETSDLTPTPRSITFKYLSILWVLPTFGAVWILIMEAGAIVSKPGILTKLAAISVEQWVALVLILLQILFLGLTRHYRQKETTSKVSGS